METLLCISPFVLIVLMVLGWSIWYVRANTANRPYERRVLAATPPGSWRPTNSPRQQRVEPSSRKGLVIVGAVGASLLLLFMVFYCVGVSAGNTAYVYLGSFSDSDSAIMEQEILQQVPKGSPKADIFQYLKENNIHKDVFGNIQGFRYREYPVERRITVVWTERGLVCVPKSYQIDFMLDVEERLESVHVITIGGGCL